MQYIDVQWIHENSDDPVRLVSELDDERFETRKIEFFPHGKVGTADIDHSDPDTRLGEGAVPSLEEINADPQFLGIAIQAAEFEALWAIHRGKQKAGPQE